MKHSSEAFGKAAYELQQDGFAVVRECLNVDKLTELVDVYESQIIPTKHHSDVQRETYGPLGKDGLARIVHVANIHESPGIAELATDKRLLTLASACLGCEGVRPIINTELFDKPPAGNASTQTPPHQDNFYFKAKQPGVALWVTIDEADSDSGTVQFVHGSHMRGLRFHDFDWGTGGGFAKTLEDFTDEDDSLLRRVGCLKPGDVVVHHGLTIHYAPPNMTSKRRRGVVINYIAEQSAFTLADDIYQPALIFQIGEAGSLKAPLWKDWRDRHVFAATCVKCALVARRGTRDGIECNVRVDSESNMLTVELVEKNLLREAILALVKSGHVIRGASTVDSLPLQLGNLKASSTSTLATSRLPQRYVGAWILSCDESLPGEMAETKSFALWLQAPSGIYIDIRVPKTLMELNDIDFDRFEDLIKLAEIRSVAGILSCNDANLDIVVGSCTVQLHPFNGSADIRRMCWQGKENKQLLVEGFEPASFRSWKETWIPAEMPPELESIAALELIDDDEGRLGYWVVVGTWFGRVVGRKSGAVLSDTVCRSLPHALEFYADALGVDLEQAIFDYGATLGRIEAPGVFRILYDNDPRFTGTLLLDQDKHQLRRDSAVDDVLVESWSNRRWRLREPNRKLTSFGSLKRMMCD